MTNAWIRLWAAWVCSGVPDIIILVSTAPGFGSVIVMFASEICVDHIVDVNENKDILR